MPAAWIKLLLFVVASSKCIETQRSSEDYVNEIKKIKSIKEPPTVYTNKSTQVKVGMSVYNIYDIGQHMTVNMLLTLDWNDPRLSFNPQQYHSAPILVLPHSSHRHIWLPDVFFPNADDVRLHKTLREHRDTTVDYDGQVNTITHMTVKLACPINFHSYPFDTYNCSIRMESLTSTTDILQFKWFNEPFQINPDVTYLDLELIDFTTMNCSDTPYPCVQVQLLFTRPRVYYALSRYVPMVMVVVTSWCSFWMEVNQYTERVSLVTVLLLTTVVHYKFIADKMVHTCRVKAIDVFFVITMLFLFLALAEATVVKVLGVKNHENMTTSVMDRFYSPKTAKLIDLVSRVAFAVVFVITVIIYCVVYTV